MSDNEACRLKSPTRTPWNKGKLMGAKPPLRPKHVWSIRTRLMVDGRVRDLAMFNLAIDSKLRGCDVVALKAAWILRSKPEFTCSVEHRHASDLRRSTPRVLAPVRVMLSRAIIT